MKKYLARSCRNTSISKNKKTRVSKNRFIRELMKSNNRTSNWGYWYPKNIWIATIWKGNNINN